MRRILLALCETYVNTPVGTTLAHALTSPSGGKTQYVWVKDKTPPSMQLGLGRLTDFFLLGYSEQIRGRDLVVGPLRIYVSSEALSEDTIQITLQLNEPGARFIVEG